MTRPAARAPATRIPAARTRPSLLLWRWRHLVVGLAVGAAVLVALSVLRPAPDSGVEVLVAARPADQIGRASCRERV